MWQWIKTHPQRTAGFLLTAFGSLQTSLALFQASIPPLTASIITAVFGLLVSALAWIQKNLQDQPEIQR